MGSRLSPVDKSGVEHPGRSMEKIHGSSRCAYLSQGDQQFFHTGEHPLVSVLLWLPGKENFLSLH